MVETQPYKLRDASDTTHHARRARLFCRYFIYNTMVGNLAYDMVVDTQFHTLYARHLLEQVARISWQVRRGETSAAIEIGWSEGWKRTHGVGGWCYSQHRNPCTTAKTIPHLRNSKQFSPKKLSHTNSKYFVPKSVRALLKELRDELWLCRITLAHPRKKKHTQPD